MSPSIPSAFVDVREADFDVLDAERHERAFPWRFDRGHCGGKFAVGSPLEEAVSSEFVSEAKFPASWENTGNCLRVGLWVPLLARNWHNGNSVVWYKTQLRCLRTHLQAAN